MPETYPWIRAWVAYCNLGPIPLEQLLAKATTEQAPADAYTRTVSGVWRLTSEITDPAMRERMGLPAL